MIEFFFYYDIGKFPTHALTISWAINKEFEFQSYELDDDDILEKKWTLIIQYDELSEDNFNALNNSFSNDVDEYDGFGEDLEYNKESNEESNEENK